MIGLGLGLFVSGVTRSQFLASQITILSGFLPAVILSGFIFDLRSAPGPGRLACARLSAGLLHGAAAARLFNGRDAGTRDPGLCRAHGLCRIVSYARVRAVRQEDPEMSAYFSVALTALVKKEFLSVFKDGTSPHDSCGAHHSLHHSLRVYRKF